MTVSPSSPPIHSLVLSHGTYLASASGLCGFRVTLCNLVETMYDQNCQIGAPECGGTRCSDRCWAVYHRARICARTAEGFSLGSTHSSEYLVPGRAKTMLPPVYMRGSFWKCGQCIAYGSTDESRLISCIQHPEKGTDYLVEWVPIYLLYDDDGFTVAPDMCFWVVWRSFLLVCQTLVHPDKVFCLASLSSPRHR